MSRRLLLTIIASNALFLSACLDRKVETPPDNSRYDPMLSITHSIYDLKAMNGVFNNVNGGDTSVILQDVVVSGVVVADDRSGNFYKQIVVQDSTGGIMVNIDAYSLYNDFPVGRKIYIRAKGLVLGYDGGLPQLGYGVSEQLGVQGIPGGRINEFIVRGPVNQPVRSDTIGFSDLYKGATTQIFDLTAPSQAKLLNRLVTIKEVEFQNKNVTWTQPNGSTNRDLKECGHLKTLATRNSNYCTFASQMVPTGKGTITGILTVYKGSGYATPQLLIRDTADVNMRGTPCDGNPIISPLVSIDSIRRVFKGTVVKLGPCRITGTVITDGPNKNVSSGLMTIQSENKGINIYVGATAAAAYGIGDSLVLTLRNDSLKSYQGMLEIEDEDFDMLIQKIASGIAVVPRQVSISELLTNFQAYEATLVKVSGATIQGGGTYGGNKNLVDATGTIILRTASTATFAGQTTPSAAKSFTGMAGWFGTTRQLLLRNLGDVQ